jgi:Tol biopolymer transport system component
VKVFPLLYGVCLLTMVSIVSAARLSEAQTPWIIYSDFNYHDGVELYRIRADGRQPQRLTRNNITERVPTWSPDARWIAFAVNDMENFRIFRLRLRDLSIRLVTEGSGFAYRLIWSGQQLIYETSSRSGANLVWTVDAAGGSPQPSDYSFDNAPSIAPAPDGNWIAKTEYLEDGTLALFRARLDRDERQLLAEHLAGDTVYRWSPLFDLPFHALLMLLVGVVILVVGMR